MSDPKEAARLLEMARKDFQAMRALTSREAAGIEVFGFHAQQAVEKAIKGVFIHLRFAFPFTHDLAKLLKLLERAGLKIPKYLNNAKNLTPFAVVTRYPDYVEPVTEKEYRNSVGIADKAYHWAENQIKKAP